VVHAITWLKHGPSQGRVGSSCGHRVEAGSRSTEAAGGADAGIRRSRSREATGCAGVGLRWWWSWEASAGSGGSGDLA
jgi:hypothetical protein